MGRARQSSATPTRPTTDHGSAGSMATSSRLCEKAVSRWSSRAAGPTARYVARSGGGLLQPKMSSGLTEKAFAAVWPGIGVPNTGHWRSAHGA